MQFHLLYFFRILFALNDNIMEQNLNVNTYSMIFSTIF